MNPNTTKTTITAAATDTNVKEDPFSKMLANVLKDSSLLKKNTQLELPAALPDVAKENKVEKSEGEEKIGVVVTENQSPKNRGLIETKMEDSLKEKTIARSEIIYNPEVKVDSSPVKILGVRGREGSEMIYVDKDKNASDTIRVFIPKETSSGNPENLPQEAVKTPFAKDSGFTITPTVISTSKEAGNESTLIVKDELKNKPLVISDEEIKKPASQVFIIRGGSDLKVKENGNEPSLILLPSVSTKTTNSDCKDLANNSDFLKIRKRMAAEKGNDAMVLAAKRFFKTKCFNTEQIRNLSFLFLNDEGRYMFFDAAYPYTSDTEKYSTLVSQLSDDYYINRFKALIQK